jgi:acyl carrier protein
MENRIKKVVANVLGLSIEEINDNTSPENVDVWDSLKHMNLIVALEDEFDIEFDDDDIIEIMDYKSIVSRLSSKIED